MKNLPFQRATGIATPAVPAIWPNRAVRRALKYSRALPTQWEIFFQQNPELRVIASR